MSLSRWRSSRFSVSGRMSQNTGRAPRNTNAFTVDTKVNDGTTTSSPGTISSSSAATASACVHDVVNRTLAAPSSFSSSSWHFFVNRPSPEMCPISSASEIYRNSSPTSPARLKGIRVPLMRSLSPDKTSDETRFPSSSSQNHISVTAVAPRHCAPASLRGSSRRLPAQTSEPRASPGFFPNLFRAPFPSHQPDQSVLSLNLERGTLRILQLPRLLPQRTLYG